MTVRQLLAFPLAKLFDDLLDVTAVSGFRMSAHGVRRQLRRQRGAKLILAINHDLLEALHVWNA